MNDETKKPGPPKKDGGKGGGAGDGKGRGGPRKPGFGKPGPGKPGFGKPGGEKPRAGKPGAGKWKPREQGAAAGEEHRPRKPYAPREDGGEAKPFQRQDGMKRAFAKTADGRPAKPRPGKWERREAAAETGEGERRPRKPYAPRDGDKPRSDRPRSDRPRSDKPPFDSRKPRDGDAKPFRRPDGEKRPFTRRDDRKAPPRRDRPGREDAPAAAQDEGDVERIARRLARAGVASRRDAEDMIAAGRITLNGKMLDTPAINGGARDRIEIDGEPIPDIERTRLFLFHKPAGLVTTSRDPEGRKTVFDVLPAGVPRLMTIGRLDINTEGLLLLTNDGGLSRMLELPATGWLRRYRVRVHGKVEPQALEGLKEGIAVDGVFYGAVEATLDREQGSNAWLTLGLREGKNREVRNILGALGLDVTRLIRVSYGPFQLGDLAEGELREIKGKHLRDQLGERLIAEAGANFDAPVLNVVPGREEKADRPRPAPHSERRGEDRREAKREDALGRLDTRKPAHGKPAYGKPAHGKPAGKFGPKPGGKPGGFGKPGPRGERPERAEEKPRQRTANVWMAPGAKPMGEKKKAALAERGEGRRYAGKGFSKPGGGKPGGDRPGGGKPSGRPAGQPSGPRKPRGRG
jgi:23S rRNA pseudouridine2605 synthase